MNEGGAAWREFWRMFDEMYPGVRTRWGVQLISDGNASLLGQALPTYP